jgi:hypothetical protein
MYFGSFQQRSLVNTGFPPLKVPIRRKLGPDGPSVGHTIEIIGGNELGMHGEGCLRCQVQLRDLLPHIPRDERDGRLHFGHDALGFLNALQAALAKPFVLGDRSNLLDVRLDISGNELAVSTYPAVEIDKMVVVADATSGRSAAPWHRCAPERLAPAVPAAALSQRP